MTTIGQGVLVDGIRRRRRWAWIALACVGPLGLAWYWLGHEVIGVVGGYADADLDTRDKFSSVAGLWVGVASLLVSIIGLSIQVGRDRPGASAAPTASGGASMAGMMSLAVPEGMAGEHIRGRDALVAELTGLFRWRVRRTARVRVLYGMGGSGKTTIARQVARRLEQRGVVVWWVSAAVATDLQTAMRQLAVRLGASAQELERDWADGASDVLCRRLVTYPARWLLVVDNADDPRMLAPAGEPVAAGRGWIRPVTTRRGAILVTSRDGDPATWGSGPRRDGQPTRDSWCQLHLVGVLSTADGAQVLLDHAGTQAGTREQAAALADRLGGLALALSLAGRYLTNAHRLPLPGAVTTFAAYRAALDAGGVPAVFDHPESVATEAEARRLIDRTWELSLDLLDDRGLPRARSSPAPAPRQRCRA